MDRIALIAACLALFADAATAQLSSAKPAQERVRGDVVAVDGNTIKVKSRTGDILTLKLADDARISLVEKADLGDIRNGAFIGTAAVPERDGSLRAIEVHVFPDSMRGTGEGHRPWDLKPGSTMTNGSVAAVDTKGAQPPSTMTNAKVTNVSGRKLTLKYAGGEKTVVVSPDTTVVKLEPADRSRLTPGAHLFAVGSRLPDGTLRAERVTVGKDGLVPPM